MSRFNFSREEEQHPNLPKMSDSERFEERMRNLMSPIITYFELLNDEEFKKYPGHEKILNECKESASESVSRIQTILKG